MDIGPNQRALIDALRSGEYQQDRGQLRNIKSGGYCCLGVACTLAGLKEIVPHEHAEDYAFVDSNGDTATVYAPQVVVEHFGLFNSHGGHCSFDSTKELANLNDHVKMSFREIANLLETHPEDYFKESK